MKRSILPFAFGAIYLIPIFLLSSYSITQMSPNKNWTILLFGFFLAACGAIIVTLMTSFWEKVICREATASLPSQEEEKPNIEPRHEITEEFAQCKQKFQQELAGKDHSLQESHEKICELHLELEQKQQQCTLLENKIRDLSYEIKTLVQLADLNDPFTEDVAESRQKKKKNMRKDSPLLLKEEASQYHVGHTPFAADAQIQTSEEARNQLKRCVDMAQKIGGSYYFGSGWRFREATADPYAIDLRRLFDSLRSETSSLVILYSQRDGKLLFANPQSKQLVGWVPEKFIQEFPSIVHQSLQEWQVALDSALSKGEGQTSLSIQTKTGQIVDLQCILGLVPTGLFKNHVIGILYIRPLA